MNVDFFLTATHVLKAAQLEVDGSSRKIGLVIKSSDNPDASYFSSFGRTESAPAPSDVTIGQISAFTKSWFFCNDQSVSGWKDVATMGYPDTAVNDASFRFDMHLRMLKGYVQRPIGKNSLPQRAPHPDLYELNFAIPSSMSGSPLFSAESSRQLLLGICIGSVKYETTDYEEIHVSDEGAEYHENKLKVEQYGIAESLVPLLTWRPELFGGTALANMIVTSPD